MLAENLARALKRGPDDFAEVVSCSGRDDGSGFQAGHVEKVRNEAVQALRLVDDRSEEFRLGLIVERTRKVPQGPGGAEDCRQGRLQIVRNRGEERLPEPIGLGSELGALDVLDEVHALDRERSLVRECIKQPALLRAEERAGLVAVDPDYADRAASRPHGQEQPLRTWQGVGAASGRPVVLPGPFRRGEIGLIEGVLRRVAGLHLKRAVLWQEKHHAHVQHGGDLERACPQHIIERSDAGELAAEACRAPPWSGPVPER